MRLPLQEPPGLLIAPSLTLEGHLFLKQFLEPMFSHKNHIFGQKWLKQWLILRSSGSLSKKKCKSWKVCLDCIYVDGLHVSLSQRALNATQNSSKKTNICKTHYFLLKTRDKSRNLSQKGVHMGEKISGVAPLWAPLAPQSVFWYEKCIQSAPKVTLRCQNWSQKWCQSGSKIIKI